MKEALVYTVKHLVQVNSKRKTKLHANFNHDLNIKHQDNKSIQVGLTPNEWEKRRVYNFFFQIDGLRTHGSYRLFGGKNEGLFKEQNHFFPRI